MWHWLWLIGVCFDVRRDIDFCLMIDITSLKSQLTDDRIIELMDTLGAPLMKADSNNLIFPSICHHGADCQAHKPRLYYYIESQSWFCFVCHFSGDTISLIQHVKHIDFNQAVSYICSILHLQVGQIEENKCIDSWAELRRFLPNAEPEPDKLLTYDKSILSLFDHLYPQEWLDYGISADILDKFGIGWYARQACISIPVVFNGQLVGVRGRYTREQDVAKGKYRPICTLDGQVLKLATSQVMYGYDQNKTAIEKSRQVVLFESEKSVLKSPQYGINNALAVFGSNISRQHIQLLLELGVNDVVLCMDSDYKQVGDDEFKFFVVKMKKLAVKLKPFFNCSIVYNNQGYDMYKCNMMDIPYEQAMKLWESRVRA